MIPDDGKQAKGHSIKSRTRRIIMEAITVAIMVAKPYNIYENFNSYFHENYMTYLSNFSS
jgi:hypothetical protein